MRNNRKLKNMTSHFSNGNELDIYTIKNSSKSRKIKRVNYVQNSTKSFKKTAKTNGKLKFDSNSDSGNNNNNNNTNKDFIKTQSIEKEQSISEVVNHLSKALDKESISNDVRNSNSGVHTLFHYTPNQRVEKINFEKDKCPVCNYLKRQRIQSTDAVLESRNNDLSIKSDRFRVKSASEGSEPKITESVSSYSSKKLSFTFEFSYPNDCDSSDSAFCNGISVDLTNCENVSFRIEKLSEISSRYYSNSFSSMNNNDYQSHAISQKHNLINQNFSSNNFSLNNFSSFSLSPYVSVLIPNSLKKCFFCQSNLTFCYECRKTPPSSFSNFNYSCSSCKVCNYNEYSDLISKSACVIAEPIQSSRSNDIFDSLKTCLIPQRFLNYYKIVAPPNRNWHIIEKPSDGMSFTLMCYNVLCQKYATSHMYPYCPAFALDWEYRKRGILEEIWKYKADIICLQELETSQYENVFSVELRKRNYDGLFVPKSRSRTMHESDSKCVDGCAIFWKVECFEKVDHVTHEFMLSCIGVSKNPAPELLNRVMNRDNVALSIILEVKDPKMNKRKLCVSTGHIHWDPEYSDVKLIQTLFWSSELWNYIRDYYKSENLLHLSPCDMPVILCGDFNSLPQSGVVDYLIKGEVERSHVDFREFGDKYLFNEWSAMQDEFVENDVLKHRFNFDRAYKDEHESGLKWTNYTYDFRGIIDYIFFSKEHLGLLGNLKQIPESWFEQQKIVGAPHVHFNSDHFSLLVELELRNSTLSSSSGQNINNSNSSNPINVNSQLTNSVSSNSTTAITTTAYPYRGQSAWSS